MNLRVAYVNFEILQMNVGFRFLAENVPRLCLSEKKIQFLDPKVLP